LQDEIMQKISIEDKGAVAILRLTNGVTNAIGPELVKDLSIASTQIRNELKA
jgi:ethanolamine utilization microcompartment shell protein EutS|tara:strand:+ start:308 stop:463 length:156 start_codon:yes stop_codon:yes gene_type:complete